MPLNPEQIEVFKSIVKLASIECGYKLSSLINRTTSLEFTGITDSLMSGDKIAIKKDCFLVTAPISEPELGPVSLIVSNKQVFCIADLVMGGDGNADDGAKPDETNQMVYAETLNTVIKSLFERFGQHSEAKMSTGSHEYRELFSIKDATLGQPKGAEDSVALTFKLNVAAKIDDVIHVEVNTKALEFVIENLQTKLAEIDEAAFKRKIKSEYLPEDEEEATEEVAEIDDGTDSAYKVDEKRNLSFLTDINVDLSVELGRSEMMLAKLLRLAKGSAIELERQCSEPVDLYAHNQLIARGEVVAIDDCFGIKITEVLGDLKLAQKMGVSLK